MKTGVRRDAGTTKNGEARVFPFTSELLRVLEQQQKVAANLNREHGTIVRRVFCYIDGKKTGRTQSRRLAGPHRRVGLDPHKRRSV